MSQVAKQPEEASVHSFEFTQSYFHPRYKSETDSPSLEFANSPIFLHNPLDIIQLALFHTPPQVTGQKG